MQENKPISRGQARRQAMLEAAAALFTEQGYERTSLSDILECSKGSRSTLYAQFGGKEGLLKALIQQMSQNFWQALGQSPAPQPLDEAALVDLGCQLLRAALDPRALAVLRLIQSVGPRSPEIADYFHSIGPRAVEEHIARLFRQGWADLALPAACQATPRDLAACYLWAVMGDTHIRAMAGLPPPWDAEKMRRLVAVRVRFFLHGMSGAAGAAGADQRQA
ncbi:HTH-type transcriptional repressor ComR [mine drainage metagenome]|uniref:HTH-type transcriptional repressor ComR n=1 Tax=mine drainage metagenome TaxID=410659 RepID=A0A1J5QGA0_9ZZZZ